MGATGAAVGDQPRWRPPALRTLRWRRYVCRHECASRGRGRSVRIGTVRSSAWIWVLSSLPTPTVPAGWSRHNPTASRILASRGVGAERERLGLLGRKAQRPQIRATVATLMPRQSPPSRADQCVTLRLRWRLQSYGVEPGGVV